MTQQLRDAATCSVRNCADCSMSPQSPIFCTEYLAKQIQDIKLKHNVIKVTLGALSDTIKDNNSDDVYAAVLAVIKVVSTTMGGKDAE